MIRNGPAVTLKQYITYINKLAGNKRKTQKRVQRQLSINDDDDEDNDDNDDNKTKKRRLTKIK